MRDQIRSDLARLSRRLDATVEPKQVRNHRELCEWALQNDIAVADYAGNLAVRLRRWVRWALILAAASLFCALVAMAFAIGTFVAV